jgi:hypothetical protein
MASKDDWLPQNHEALYDQVNQTVNYLSILMHLASMGLDSTGMINWIHGTFQSAVDEFNTAFIAWKDEATRTKIRMITLQEAEKKLKPLYRQLYIGSLKNNPLVTNIDLKAMDLPLRPDGRHLEPSPVPLDFPGVKFDTSMIRRIIVSFFALDNLLKAKPKGVHGCEMLWGVFDISVTRLEELTHSAFDTRSPYTITFTDEQRVKHFCFALRWENTRGEKGPWSEIHIAIIP